MIQLPPNSSELSCLGCHVSWPQIHRCPFLRLFFSARFFSKKNLLKRVKLSWATAALCLVLCCVGCAVGPMELSCEVCGDQTDLVCSDCRCAFYCRQHRSPSLNTLTLSPYSPHCAVYSHLSAHTHTHLPSAQSYRQTAHRPARAASSPLAHAYLLLALYPASSTSNLTDPLLDTQSCFHTVTTAPHIAVALTGCLRAVESISRSTGISTGFYVPPGQLKTSHRAASR